ncbi:MAG: hypothetical protein OEY78_08635 [Gammaproteobacteria bacterium]|nr:hypothetical protein [Gammaproteobacteria bacterium]
MYFWKVDQLVEDFRNDNVTQKEQFHYILLFTILTILGSDPALYIDFTYHINDLYMSILLLTVNICGVFYLYIKNSTGDNKDFLPRVICLGLPVLIRTIVFCIPILFLIGFVEAFFEPELNTADLEDEIYKTTYGEIAAVNFVIMFYYYYLAKKISLLSQKKA